MQWSINILFQPFIHLSFSLHSLLHLSLSLSLSVCLSLSLPPLTLPFSISPSLPSSFSLPPLQFTCTSSSLFLLPCFSSIPFLSHSSIFPCFVSFSLHLSLKGCVMVFDLKNYRQVCSLSDFGRIKSLAVATSPSFHHVAIATDSPYHASHSRISVLGAPLGEPSFWEKTTLDLPGPAEYRSFKVLCGIFSGRKRSCLIWYEYLWSCARFFFCK